MPYDPAIPLLDIYLEKTLTQKDTWTPMFLAALFTIAKIWKQLKCPQTDEWVKNMWDIHTMEYYPAKKRMSSAICCNMDGPRVYHTTWSQKEKDKCHMIPFICEI